MINNPLKIIFLGTPDFAVPALETLIDSEHDVVAVYSQPPRPAGRGKKLQPSAVQQVAEENNIDVFTPTSLKSDDVQAEFSSRNADVAIVIAYGLLLPQAILDSCPMGCLNVHPSRLPRFRGAAPIQRTIMAGDSETSMMIMQMNAGLDTGNILLGLDYDIDENMTSGDLHDLLAGEAGALLLATLEGLPTKQIKPFRQSDKNIVYADKIDKKERAIDWNMTADEVHNHIRGLSPYPTASFTYRGETIKVLRSENANRISFAKAGFVMNDKLSIACGDGGIVRLKTLQRAGKKPMNVEEFLRGFPIAKGDSLVEPEDEI